MDFYREHREGIQVSFQGRLQSFTQLGGSSEGEAFLSCEMIVDSPESSEESITVRVFWMPDHRSLLKRVSSRLAPSAMIDVEGRLVENQRVLSVIARSFEVCETRAGVEHSIPSGV